VLDAGLVVVNVSPLATPREIQIQLATAAVSVIVVLENFAYKLDELLDENRVKAVISVAVGNLLPLSRRTAIDSVQRVVRDSIPPTKRGVVQNRPNLGDKDERRRPACYYG
jgi:long-chain acyl-CoA synthetase